MPVQLPSDDPGVIQFPSDSLTNSVLGAFGNVMAPGFSELISSYEKVHGVKINVKGAGDMSLLFLRSIYPTWADHPALTELTSRATPRGLEWIKGVLSTPTYRCVNFGKQRILTSTGVVEYGRNNSVDLSMGSLKTVFADCPFPSISSGVSWDASITQSPTYAAGVSPSWENVANPAFQTMFASRAAYAKEVAHRLGYRNVREEYLAVRGLIITNASGTVNDQLHKLGIYSAAKHGYKYLIFAGTFYNAGLGGAIILYVPDDKRGDEVNFVWSMETGKIGHKAIVFDDPRYKYGVAASNPSSGSFDWDINILNANYNSFGVESVDALGIPLPGVNPLQGFTADGNKFSSDAIARFSRSHGSYLLPIIAPIGSAEMMLKVGPSSEVVHTVLQATHDGIGEPIAGAIEASDPLYSSSRALLSTSNMIADQMLIGIPHDWYVDYLESGYGFFDPLKGEDLAKAKTLAESYSGMKLTSVTYATPMMLPTNIVERLQVYRLYKKSREKACLRNNFLELEYMDGVTWGRAQNTVNGSRQTSILYGVSDQTSSAVKLAPSLSKSGLAYALSGSVQGTATKLAFTDAGKAPVIIGSDQVDAFLSNYALGASLTGVTFAALIAAWGLDTAFVTSQMNDMVEFSDHLKVYGGSAGRGYGLAPYDFTWENIGISGYPIYEELSADDAYKAAIYSKVTIGKKTESLRQAFLGFANEAGISLILKNASAK